MARRRRESKSRPGHTPERGGSIIPGLTGWIDGIKLTAPTYNVPHLYKTWSGRDLGNDLFQDRTATKNLTAIIRGWVPWFPLQNGTTADPNVTTLGTFVGRMFNLMVQELLAKKLISIRDTTVATPSNLALYLSNYANAYAALWGLNSYLVCAGMNDYLANVGQSVATRITRLEADYRMLLTLSVPPMINEIIERYFGVHALSDQGSVYIAQSISAFGGTILDCNNVTNIDVILSNVETILGNLFATGDFAIIGNIMKIMYGANKYTAPYLHSNESIYYDFIGSTICFRDSTSNKIFSGPSTTWTSSGGIGVLVPYGAKAEDTSYTFSLLRPSPFSTDAAAGISSANFPNAIGLILPTECFTTPGGTSDIVVQPGVVVSAATENTHAGAIDISAEGAVNALAWYGAHVWNESGSFNANAVGDFRPRNNLDMVYVPKTVFLDETQFMIEKLFSTGKVV